MNKPPADVASTSGTSVNTTNATTNNRSSLNLTNETTKNDDRKCSAPATSKSESESTTTTTTGSKPGVLNVNIVNEEAAKIGAVSSSTLSMSSIATKKLINSNLSLNTKKAIVPTVNIFSSLKNSTLNASKLFNKATSRSNSPMHPSSVGLKLHHHNHHHPQMKPIDLEAHIITDDKGQATSVAGAQTSNKNDLSSSSVDEEDDSDESSEESNARKAKVHTSKLNLNVACDQQRKLDIHSVLPIPAITAKKQKNSLLTSPNLIHDEDEDDDDDDDDDDIDIQAEHLNEHRLRRLSNLKERRQSKLNSAAVARCSLKTMSNLPSSTNVSLVQTNVRSNRHTPCELNQSNSQLNKLDSSVANFKKDIQAVDSNVKNLGSSVANTAVRVARQSSSSPPPLSPPIIVTGGVIAPAQCPPSPPPTPQSPAPPLVPNMQLGQKTILSTRSSNSNCTAVLSIHGSRQSVSFLEPKQQQQEQNNNNETELKNQRISDQSEEDECRPILKSETLDNLDAHTKKTEYLKQQSAPAATGVVDESTSGPLQPAKGVLSKHLTPLELNLNLNSSFASTNTGLASSCSPSLSHRPVVESASSPHPFAIKVLHKSMTKGSKAMRVMGNNSNNVSSSNGPIKSSLSLGAFSIKSASSFGRSNTAKKLAQKRLFFKNGNINISRSNIDKRRRRYMTDIFTTLIDLKWRYNILVFALGFFMSWTFFAIAWYLISFVHGDLNPPNANHTVCVSGIHGFAGAILFSIETQQTIGYGVRFTTEKCPEAIFVMMIQSSVGVMIQSFMVGVVFAKLSRPKKRSETLMFSKNAVISLRDGRLCLICRVGDMRKSHIVEAHVRMYLVKKKVTLEGEILPLHMYDLNVGWDKGLDRLFLVWPLTIEHNIDENSPLWTVSAEDLKKERFELAVILEGIVESTGMTTQARSSYLVNEILWGHRFEKLITFQKEDGTYKIDYSRFDTTVPIDTPTCSAKELAELREQEKYFAHNNYEMPATPTTINTHHMSSSNLLTADLRKRNNRLTDDDGNDSSITAALTPRSFNNGASSIKMIIEDHSSKPANELSTDAHFVYPSTDNLSNYVSTDNTQPLINISHNEHDIF